MLSRAQINKNLHLPPIQDVPGQDAPVMASFSGPATGEWNQGLIV